MFATNATPKEIFKWFHSGEHNLEVLCILLSRNADDQEKSEQLVKEFESYDIAMGQQIGLLVCVPQNGRSLGPLISPFNETADFSVGVLPLRNINTLTDLPYAKSARNALAEIVTRQTALLTPEFLELIDGTYDDLPALAVAVRGQEKGKMIPLGKSWSGESVREWLSNLSKAAASEERLGPADILFLDRLSTCIGRIEGTERGIDRRLRDLEKSFNKLLRRFSASNIDLKRAAIFLANKDFSAECFESLLAGFSFSGHERLQADGELRRIRRTLEVLRQHHKRIEEELHNLEPPDSVERARERLERRSVRILRTIEELEVIGSRTVRFGGPISPTWTAFRRLADNVNRWGDFGQKLVATAGWLKTFL